MPVRAPPQCRQTLARKPTPTAPSLWITDRMLFEAFQRYSLSSIRSTGADARCVHFNAGPLEHQRRAGKRRMTAVLPVSRLELPAWLLSLSHYELSPTWSPPTKASERHQKGAKAGVLDNIIAWLEDSPPDKPFITPPTDVASHQASEEVTSASSTASVASIAVGAAEASDSAAASIGAEAVDAEIVDESQSVAASQSKINTRDLMAALREDLLASPRTIKSQYEVLSKYEEEATRCLLRQDLLTSDLQTLLEPFSGLLDWEAHSRSGLFIWVQGEWRGRIARILRDINAENPQAVQDKTWVHLTKVLCQSPLPEMGAGSIRLQSQPEQAMPGTSKNLVSSWSSWLKHSATTMTDLWRNPITLKSQTHDGGWHSLSGDALYSWCASLKQLAFTIKDLRPEQQSHLVHGMEEALWSSSTAAKHIDTHTALPTSMALGWAVLAMWQQQSGKFQKAFDRIYGDLVCRADASLRDTPTFYLVLSNLFYNKALSRTEFSRVYDYHGHDSRWAVMFSRLAWQSHKGRVNLEGTGALLRRIGYFEQASASVMAAANPGIERCVEGLAIATCDHRAALRLHDLRVFLDSRKASDSRQRWSHITWAPYVHTMIKDPNIQLSDVTKCIASFGYGATIDGTPANDKERAGRAKLLEDMSHTLAYKAPNFRPWRIWKELSLWNLLYRKLTGEFSAQIGSIMVEVTVTRMKSGEVIGRRRLNYLVDVVRRLDGDVVAEKFRKKSLAWQKRNLELGTEEQKFPTRFHSQRSSAEEAQKAVERLQEEQDLAAVMRAGRVTDEGAKQSPQRRREKGVSRFA